MDKFCPSFDRLLRKKFPPAVVVSETCAAVGVKTVVVATTSGAEVVTAGPPWGALRQLPSNNKQTA